LAGRISTILTQRGSVIGISLTGRHHTSWCTAGIVCIGAVMTMSGGPCPSRSPCQYRPFAIGFGVKSAGFPSGAP